MIVRTAAAAAMLGLAFPLLASCGGGGSDAPATAPAAAVQATATALSTALPGGDPGVTVEQVIQACREKNGGLLRNFVAEVVSEQELEELFERGTDVMLKGRTFPEVEDGVATVEVHLEVRRNGEALMVHRAWELERGPDGVWRLKSLPDCY